MAGAPNFWPTLHPGDYVLIQVGKKTLCFNPPPASRRRGSWIVLDVAAQVPGQEPGLQVRQRADGHLFVEKRMLDFLPLALVERGEDGLAGLVVHENGAAGLGLETVGPDLPEVDERQGQPVGPQRSEFQRRA
jgi:hypothetical protein